LRICKQSFVFLGFHSHKPSYAILADHKEEIKGVMGNWIYNSISKPVVAMIKRFDIEGAFDNVEKQRSEENRSSITT
jgi:hypothetical protein